MRDQKEMTLLEHLAELRDRLKVVGIAYIASLVFWLVFPKDFNDIGALLNGEYIPMITLVLENVEGMARGTLRIIAGRLTSPIEIYFIAAALMAFITSSPVIAYEFYKYIDPALYPHERRVLYGFMAAFVGLYAAGAIFSYLFVVPLVLRFMVIFARIVRAEPDILAGDFYSLVFMSVALMGLLFTSPAIFVLLVRLGVIKTTAFTNNRIYIYGLLYILIALITPDGWLIGNTLLFLPMVILLEVAVLIAKRYERSREAADAGPPKEKCRFCGGEVPLGGVFCSSCGRSQE